MSGFEKRIGICKKKNNKLAKNTEDHTFPDSLNNLFRTNPLDRISSEILDPNEIIIIIRNDINPPNSEKINPPVSINWTVIPVKKKNPPTIIPKVIDDFILFVTRSTAFKKPSFSYFEI